jgi:thiopurine S-methyltransferase
MEPKFWHERWESSQIGFHQHDVNQQLNRHASKLASLCEGPRVLVPLCGKSGDMTYLRSLGYEVVGVELSPIAAAAYFSEHEKTPVVTQPEKSVACYEADGITILCGDFFDVTPDVLGPVHAAYDRAALVALPPETRKRYAAHLASVMPPGAPVLLVTFDYPQAEMSGPPFSVPQTEVEQLFRQHFDIVLVEDEDGFDTSGKNGRPAFKDRLSRAREQTYVLTRNSR